MLFRSSVAVSGSNVLVGGSFTTYKGVACPYVVSLSSNGTRITEFNQSGTGPNSSVYKIVPSRLSNQVYIFGLFTTYNGTATPGGIARLNADGTLDTSFALSTIYGSSYYSGMTFTSITEADNGDLHVTGERAANYTSGFPNPGNAPYMVLSSTGAVKKFIGLTAFYGSFAFNGSLGKAILTPDGRVIIPSGSQIATGSDSRSGNYLYCPLISNDKPVRMVDPTYTFPLSDFL